jgi:hypothetical protein
VEAKAPDWKRGDPPILDQVVIGELRPATPNEPNALDILARIYDSEINVGLQSDWEGGFRVWLGDNWIGHIVEGWFGPEELDKVGPWLDYQTRRFYPESDYAKVSSPYGQGANLKRLEPSSLEPRNLR